MFEAFSQVRLYIKFVLYWLNDHEKSSTIDLQDIDCQTIKKGSHLLFDSDDQLHPILRKNSWINHGPYYQ